MCFSIVSMILCGILNIEIDTLPKKVFRPGRFTTSGKMKPIKDIIIIKHKDKKATLFN